MWYKYSESNEPEDKTELHNPDYDLAMALITSMVRHRLFLKCQYNPPTRTVQNTIKRVVKNLEQKYGSLNVMRNKSHSESLTPIIEAAVQEIFTKKS